LSSRCQDGIRLTIKSSAAEGCYSFQDNVFGKTRGRKSYGHTTTTDNAAQKDYLGFYICYPFIFSGLLKTIAPLCPVLNHPVFYGAILNNIHPVIWYRS
jgi:hypothetical protein